MKRILSLAIMLALSSTLFINLAAAQKYALIDMEYVLKNIPAYERASEQLNQVSKRWQAEVEALNTEASTMYKNYQNEVVFLSQEQKVARQDAITQKEKEAADLKKKYFGPEGELFKKRESLMSPIQEEIYNAVKEVSELRGYQMVIDRASDNGIIYASPRIDRRSGILEIPRPSSPNGRIDISNEVLQKLGY